MSDRNVFLGKDDASKVAILLELLMTTATPTPPATFSASINSALDSLTEAQANALLAGYDARLKRAQWGA